MLTLPFKSFSRNENNKNGQENKYIHASIPALLCFPDCDKLSPLPLIASVSVASSSSNLGKEKERSRGLHWNSGFTIGKKFCLSSYYIPYGSELSQFSQLCTIFFMSNILNKSFNDRPRSLNNEIMFCHPTVASALKPSSPSLGAFSPLLLC